ncbi:MAG: hypothetical protein ACYC3G_02685 [Minisyncoccota bacterium]
MNIEGINKEKEPTPKDISAEFLKMESFDFLDLLETLENEPALSIKIDWVDIWTARRLKAFLEDHSTRGNQKRSVTIRATKEQYEQELNVFASGVKWEEIK